MDQRCMTYKQIAEILQIAPGTFRKTWRQYPHFFVTPPSARPQGGNLKSARFDPEEVLRFIKQGDHRYYGDAKDTVGEMHPLRSVRQNQRCSTQKEVSNASRGKGVGISNDAIPICISSKFDVFAGL